MNEALKDAARNLINRLWAEAANTLDVSYPSHDEAYAALSRNDQLSWDLAVAVLMTRV